jgi:hypothetical protein
MEATVTLHELKIKLDRALGFIKDFMDENINEIAMHSTDYPEGFGGWKFEYRNGGKTFKYDNCPSVAKLKDELKAEEQKMKAAYASFQQGLTSVDENGEVLELPTIVNRKSSMILKQIRK